MIIHVNITGVCAYFSKPTSLTDVDFENAELLSKGLLATTLLERHDIFVRKLKVMFFLYYF